MKFHVVNLIVLISTCYFLTQWPSPANYSSRSPLLGRPQATWKSYPQFSIGVRANFSISKRGKLRSCYKLWCGDKPVIIIYMPCTSLRKCLIFIHNHFGSTEHYTIPNLYKKYFNPMRTTCRLVKISNQSYIDPITEDVRKNSLICKFLTHCY